jgi:hypothetical protein
VRHLCIDKDFLIFRYSVQDRPFWDACEDGFECMFAPQAQEVDWIGPHGVVGGNSSREVIFPGKGSVEQDWSWYVAERIGYFGRRAHEYPTFHFDDRMYDWFRKIPHNRAKQIMLVHGRTGCGKTTFVRHFFSSYLALKDKELAAHTYVLRLSFPVIGYTAARAEEEFDHTVYKFLVETFTEGNSDLRDPRNLVSMACMEYPDSEEQRVYFSEESPPPDSPAAQLKWLKEIVIARREVLQGDKPVTDFADFNRLAIRYLCKTDEKLRLVFFLDNVDHLPAPFQANAWLLARQKLSWIREWHAVSFVIAIRSYLLKNSHKESALSAYRDKILELALVPPTLFDILERRKTVFFDPRYPKREPFNAEVELERKCHIKYAGISIPLYCPNELFASLLNVFREREKDRYIAQLTNYDIRQGIEIAKAVIQYPFYHWPSLADAVYKQYREKKPQMGQLVSFERILDAVLRRTNHLCEPKLMFFDNVFMVDDSDHFSNTLCKSYILRMLAKRTHSLDEVLGILGQLGHPETIARAAIQALLDCNVITSPQGVNIEEHGISVLHSQGTTLCDQYLNNVTVTLNYLQTMVYITPLEENRARRVPLPLRVLDDSRTIEDRVEAARILLEQIESDVAEQWDYVKHRNPDTRARCNGYFADYGFDDLVGRIRNKVCSDLEHMLRSGSFARMDDERKQKLLGVFTC